MTGYRRGLFWRVGMRQLITVEHMIVCGVGLRSVVTSGHNTLDVVREVTPVAVIVLNGAAVVRAQPAV